MLDARLWLPREKRCLRPERPMWRDSPCESFLRTGRPSRAITRIGLQRWVSWGHLSLEDVDHEGRPWPEVRSAGDSTENGRSRLAFLRKKKKRRKKVRRERGHQSPIEEDEAPEPKQKRRQDILPTKGDDPLLVLVKRTPARGNYAQRHTTGEPNITSRNTEERATTDLMTTRTDRRKTTRVHVPADKMQPVCHVGRNYRSRLGF